VIRELIPEGMRGESTAGIAGHAVQNLICRSGPDEWFGIFVVDLDEFAKGRLKLFDASEGAAPRRIRLLVSSANHRSTRFSHDPYVGVKWT
jgi:hypothetical protein